MVENKFLRNLKTHIINGFNLYVWLDLLQFNVKLIGLFEELLQTMRSLVIITNLTVMLR